MDLKESKFLLEFDYLYTYRSDSWERSSMDIEEIRTATITFNTLEEVKEKVKKLGEVRNIKIFELNRLEDKLLLREE